MLANLARPKLRRRPNCQQLSSGLLRRIVEEALAEDAVAAPFLQRHLVDPRGPAGMVGEIEHPVDRNAIALEDRGHAGRGHVFHALQRGAINRSRPTRGGTAYSCMVASS